MSDESATYLQVCSLKPDQATRVSQMIASHTQFSEIEITINLDRQTYDPFLTKLIPEEKVLVIFRIPYKSVCMPIFYTEFRKALNHESTVAIQREREE